MKPCARCDWQPDRESDVSPHVQLVAHADERAHPLCAVCTRSLRQDETQTCETCLTSSQEHLAGIALMWAELPDHLGQPRGQALSSDPRSAADGRPLLGGDLLVLLGPGSQGLSEDGKTSRAGDPTSVAYELGWWEDAWREARGEPEGQRARSTRAIVRTALGYLERRMRWAATSHPGFDDFADDLRRLHGRLERATGRRQPEIRAEAECFACGADALVRELRDGKRCDHQPPAFPPPWPGPVPCPISARRQEFERLVEQFEVEHGRCQQGGHVDHWTCQRCGERYDWQRYVLACKARVEHGRLTLHAAGWGTPVQVAAAIGVPVETVRTWAKRGQVGSCCLVNGQQMLVNYTDAEKRAAGRRQGGAARCA